MERIISPKIIEDIYSICPSGCFPNTSLKGISKWNIGGVADLVIRPSTLNQVVELRKYFRQVALKHLVIGATSNLLFDDDGLRIPCIQIGRELAEVTMEGDMVTAQAGVWVPTLARKAMKQGLSGTEHTCGIPGTVGGLVYMNGGSQRRGIGDTIIAVTSVDESGNLVKRKREQCSFGYRSSIFQHIDEIIVEVNLKLEATEPRGKIRREMLDILRSRRIKFPKKEPNCGSVFKSNPEMYNKVGPPGRIIEKLGYKGYHYKSVRVSSLHANFITHNGYGQASHIRELIELIQSKVYEETGFIMDVEVQFVDQFGSIK